MTPQITAQMTQSSSNEYLTLWMTTRFLHVDRDYGNPAAEIL